MKRCLSPCFLLLLILAVPGSATARATPETCTYTTYAWHPAKGKAVNHKQVRKPYAKLGPDERDPHEPRCTPCREDQVEVKVDKIPPVTVCHIYADRVRKALESVANRVTAA